MKVGLEYGLGCGGFDGYRTITLPKYMEKYISDRDKMQKWLQQWLRSHLKEHSFNVETWMIIDK